MNHPLGLLANLLFLYGAFGWATAIADGSSWALGGALREAPWLVALLWVNAGLVLWRQSVRAYCVGRVYGHLQALTVPLRATWANLINAAATARAVAVFLRAKVLRRPLLWAKTQHTYPDAEELLLPIWIAPERVQPSLVSIIPNDMSIGIAWQAVELQGDALLVAGPENPPAHSLRRLAMRIGREVRFERVTWQNYEGLRKAGHPAEMVKGQEMTAGRP